MKTQTVQRHTAPVLRASGFSTFVRRMPLLACFALAVSTKATVPISDLPDLGSLANFREFGNQQVDNLSTIFGDVGVSGGGMLQLNAPATINGNLSLDTTATLHQMGVITGTTFNNQDLTTEQNTVISTAAALAALPADKTITGNQTMGLDFDIPAGQVEVVDLPGGLNLNDQNITLTGGGSLVLNVQSSLSLEGSASIVGNPANIFINYLEGSPITTGVATLVDGRLFDPDEDADLEGDLQGSVDAGDGTIDLESGAELTPVPEPRELILTGLGALLVHLARRRLFRRKI